jgi:hypothetical protein
MNAETETGHPGLNSLWNMMIMKNGKNEHADLKPDITL